MKNKLIPMRELLVLTIAEIFFAAVVSGVYLLINRFTPSVITGSLLGIFVTVINFIILSVSIGRAFDKALKERGTKELTEEEIEKFTAEQNVAMQAAAKKSFFIRTILMLAVLVLAFISGFFDVIATVIPLLLFRPIITVDAIFKEKREMKNELKNEKKEEEQWKA